MNTAELTHPSQDQLSAFNSGRLSEIESAEIERHLAECEACCLLLKSLPNDTLIALLRDGQTDTKAEPGRTLSPGLPESPPPGCELPTLAPHAAATCSPAIAFAPTPIEVPAELRDHPRYRVVALLGRGGMGSVYEAQHRVMNRPVALKVIDPLLVQTPGLVERFHREVQAAAKLSHPNIVTAYDAEQASDLHFLVMELVQGQDLSQVVAERGRLPLHEACEYARQAAQGLAHAFQRGMVHRDIKPQNLMLQASPDASAPGVIKILDFGLAQFASEIAEVSGLTQVGAMMGTPDYMAPEQARDAHSADIRADIYSLGCTLYCLLAGRAPYPQGSVLEKVMAHVEREPTPLPELRDDVPPELVAVLKQMMAKKPTDRFQTPAEVAEALAPFGVPPLGGEDRLKPELRTQDRLKPELQRTRSPMAIVAAALAALVILGALGVIVVVTDKGRVEIQSEVNDVEVVVKRGGKEIEVFDAQTGSRVKWLSSGKYDIELKEDRNDIEIHNGGFKLTRWGKAVVTLKRKPDAGGLAAKAAPSPATDYALRFRRKEKDIPDDYVTFPNLDLDWAAGITIEAYCTPDKDNPNGDVIDLAGFTIGVNSGRWAIGANLGRPGWTGSSQVVLDSNQRVHLAGVSVGEKLYFFVDGKLARRYDLPTGARLGTRNSFAIGTGFNGVIDEVRVSKTVRYDKFFTPGGRFEPDIDTLALYHFDEGQGDVLKDSSGNNQHGKIVGAKWITADAQNARAPADQLPKEPIREIRRFEGHTGPVRSIVFSADGKWALSGSGYPYGDNTMRLWDVETGQQLRRFGDEGLSWVMGVALSADKSRALSASWDGVIRLWDVETGKVLKRMAGHKDLAYCVVFSPDGNSAISSGGGKDKTVRLWDLTTGKELRQLEGPTGSTPSVAFSPDGHQALTGEWGDEAAVRLWDVETGTAIRSFESHPGGVHSVAFSPDGRRVLSAGYDSMIRLSHADGSGQIHVLKGHTEPVNMVVFFPDGRRALSASADKTVRIWDLETGREIGRTPLHSAVVWSIAVSPDGSRALSAAESIWKNDKWEDAKDLALRLWQLPQAPSTRQGKDALKAAPPRAIAPFNAEQAKKHQEAWAKHYGVPIEYTNSIGMKFVLIPPGEYTRGSTPVEIEAALKVAGQDQFFRDSVNSEGPQHKVILTQPVYLGSHEVTQGQYEKMMGTNPSHFAATGPGKQAVVGLDTANHPVELVSWNEAAEFCAKLSETEKRKPFYVRAGETVTLQDGNGYRLSTEAQWEFACRAGTTTRFWSGEQDEDLEQAAWLGKNSQGRTHAVGELKANPFGLFDMHGNVWEWVQDGWESSGLGRGPTYYEQFQGKPAIDPSGPTPAGSRRVFRGGDWANHATACRAASRRAFLTTDRHRSMGFRLALVVDAVKSANAKSGASIAPAPRHIAGWGEFINPDGASDAREENGRLTFTVPAGDRAFQFSPQGPVGVPRLVQEVDGDFSAQVKVLPFLDAEPYGNKDRSRSASFFVWNNDEDVHIMRYYPGHTFNNENNGFHDHVDVTGLGKIRRSSANSASYFFRRKLEVVHLKLERHGNTLTSSWSVDGENWQKPKDPVTVAWPRKIKLGVAVANRSIDELRVEFEQLTITQPGWVRLYNGTDLTGWNTSPKNANAPAWKVDQGQIMTTHEKAGGGFLHTDRTDFTDFHLRLEAKLVKGATSELFVRDQRPSPLKGYTVFMNTQTTFGTGAVTTYRLEGHHGLVKENLTKPDEWFTFEVIVQGNRLQTFVNGKQTVDSVDANKNFMTGGISIGAFGTADAGQELHIRKVEIKELPASPPD